MFFCGAAIAFAQSITGLGFQPNTVRPGEQAIYTISINGFSPKIDLNQVPIPEGLQFAGSGQNQNVSVGLGAGITREIKLNLFFIPAKEGEFEIKSWQIKHDGKTYEIPAAKLKVDANAPQQIRPTQHDPFASMRQRQQPRKSEVIDISETTKLELSLEDKKIFSGQSVPCKIVFTINGKVLKAGLTPHNISHPQIKNGDAFHSAGFFGDPAVTQSRENLTVRLEYDTFITPIKAGEHGIQFEIAGELISEPNFDNASIFAIMGGFGDRHPFRREMDIKKIKVHELPAPPADFSNAIGAFKIESVTMDETALSVGIPATFIVKVSGEGNFERMSAPTLSTNGDWKDYKPKISFEDLSSGYGRKGVKTFEYTIVPTKPDLEHAPTAKLVFFNPQTENFEMLESEKIAVSVAPSKSFAKRNAETKEANDPLGELAQTQNSAPQSDFYAQPWFWIIQAALLGSILFFTVRKRAQNRLEKDPDYARIHNAKREMKEALKRARTATKKNDAKAFFENAAFSLQCAICSISGLEAKAVILSDAEKILLKLDGGAEIYSHAKIYFEGADAIAFGGYTPNATQLASLCEKLESICQQIS